jgi:hypothetical protein
MLSEKQYWMICIAEEANEITQIASKLCHDAHKAIRFGFYDKDPNSDCYSNLEKIIQEYNDLTGTLKGLQDCGIELPNFMDPVSIKAKQDKVISFMSLSRANGILEKE